MPRTPKPPAPEPSDPSWGPEDVARYLGTTVDTVYSWRKTRSGPPAAKIGKRLRYRKSDVDRWVAARTRLDGGETS